MIMKIPRNAITFMISVSFCVVLGIYLINIYKNKSKLHRLEQLEQKDEKRVEESKDDDGSEYRDLNDHEKQKLKYLKAIITTINERQYIGSARKLNSTALLKAMALVYKWWFKNATSMKLETVLVIQVHGDNRYVKVFLESIRRVVGISECLLIFAHDFYDVHVHNVINNVHFARVMQMYYPYSIQLHPYRYPGKDRKFCEELFQCFFSEERDYIQAQTKMFWWWMVNQVFEHAEVLKSYDGYIYFLEIEQYLTNDFLILAKKLEQMQPRYCPECLILSLAARPPRPELYARENSSLIIGIWGWTNNNYINSGIGINRTTWNEIKRLKKEFCYFNDPTWENSLKYLASKTHDRLFYMLSTQGPRIFPTNDCTVLGYGSQCDVESTYKDIVNFIRRTSRGMFPYHFALDFDVLEGARPDAVWVVGGWEDARDREMCMFIASNGRRVYY